MDMEDLDWLDRMTDLVDRAPAGEGIFNECMEITELLLNKNISYGNTATNPIHIFSTATATERLASRIDDKINRLLNGQEFPGDDTILDLIGYLILYRVALEGDSNE